MITKITAGLLAVTLLAACETTTRTTQRTTLREMNASRMASSDTSSANSLNPNEPAPPAEGPEDIPAEGPRDVARNPALVPSPLLRVNAAGGP
jgi:guanyl-specific ribonuclease Sa